MFGLGAAVLAAFLAAVFAYDLRPAAAGAGSGAAGVAGAPVSAGQVIFSVTQGEGFREVVKNLGAMDLVRSPFATEAFALVSGTAFRIQPGLYRLSPSMSAPAILNTLAVGSANEATVAIPEGANLFQIDAALANALVLRPGVFARAALAGGDEGKLFPDTYRFFTGADAGSVIGKFIDNFNAKAAPLLPKSAAAAARDLTMASIVDKEVRTPEDQAIVAGILVKRIAAGMPLQMDATVCYAKLLAASSSVLAAGVPPCYPMTALDFKIDSPYNTYLYKGLPPGPIGNPGIAAISAVLHPQSSPYWFYLSDPKTGKTIFAKTLDEQAQNKVKYLESD